MAEEVNVTEVLRAAAGGTRGSGGAVKGRNAGSRAWELVRVSKGLCGWHGADEWTGGILRVGRLKTVACDR